MIVKNQLIPSFALESKNTIALEEQTILRVNYGERPFQYQVNALSLNQIIQYLPIKGFCFLNEVWIQSPLLKEAVRMHFVIKCHKKKINFILR